MWLLGVRVNYVWFLEDFLIILNIGGFKFILLIFVQLQVRSCNIFSMISGASPEEVMVTIVKVYSRFSTFFTFLKAMIIIRYSFR